MPIKSKRTIMGVAALMILVFHFYIPVFRNNMLEKQIASLGFIGVDLFFLVSGITCGKSEKIRFFDFVINRFISVWLPFSVFTLVAALYKKWSVGSFFQNIFGIRLFTKGGGAFCWFFPGIMIFYILAPGLVYLKKKLGLKALGLLMVLWLATAVVLQYVVGYTTIFILLNRLPIFLIGIWLDELNIVPRKWRLPLVAAALAGGGYLMFLYGVLIRSTKPIADFKYIAAIPFVIAISVLIDKIAAACKLKFQFFKWLGGFTLELYALQMIFGYDIIKRISKITGTNARAFCSTAGILILVSFALALTKKSILKKIYESKEK